MHERGFSAVKHLGWLAALLAPMMAGTLCMAQQGAQERTEHVSTKVRALSGADRGMMQKVAKDLMGFAPSDFDAEARASLGGLLALQSPRPEVVRLIAVAGMREQSARLESLRIDERKFEAQPHMGKWYGTAGWAARLALARMGNQNDLHRCIELVETEPSLITRVTILLADLAFTHQPSAINVIGTFLHSEERLPPVQPGVPGMPYSQHAADVLADSIRGFPVAKKYVGGYSEDEIGVARSWMHAQTTYEFK